MSYRGLFVGLTTLDFIYLSDRPLQANQKIVAKDYLTVAGGPATNAAVAFAAFGNQSHLLSVVGRHPLTELIRDDLKRHAVSSIDLMPGKTESPPVSSIVVSAATGERGIISINAVKSQVDFAPADPLDKIDLLLVDGHQLEVSLKLAALAKKRQIPIVLDGGSWKPRLEKLLGFVDYAICSANFYPPQSQHGDEVFSYLTKCGVERIAITHGEQAIQYLDLSTGGTVEVPQIKAVDTLGAGDIFHGAFCHHILQEQFPRALKLAAQTASHSCLFFGTRSWLKQPF